MNVDHGMCVDGSFVIGIWLMLLVMTSIYWMRMSVVNGASIEAALDIFGCYLLRLFLNSLNPSQQCSQQMRRSLYGLIGTNSSEGLRVKVGRRLSASSKCKSCDGREDGNRDRGGSVAKQAELIDQRSWYVRLLSSFFSQFFLLIYNY